MKPQPINIVLSSTKQNVVPWTKAFETYTAIKGLSSHLKYDNFASYFAIEHIPSEREILYNTQVEDIKNQELTQAQQTLEINKLNKLYPDTVSWSAEKVKEQRAWKENQEKLFGILRATMEEQYWISIKDLDSVYKAWNQLKIETQQDQAGHFMANLIKFFTARIKPGQDLTNYTAHLQAIANQTSDLGHDILSPTLICYYILATMPAEYEQIQQSIFQLPIQEITLENIKAKFAAEDSRQQAKKLQQTNNNDSKRRIPEQAYAATVERNCTICKQPIPSTAPISHQRCSTKCNSQYYQDKQQPEDTKSNKSKSKPKTESANVLYVF